MFSIETQMNTQVREQLRILMELAEKKGLGHWSKMVENPHGKPRNYRWYFLGLMVV